MRTTLLLLTATLTACGFSPEAQRVIDVTLAREAEGHWRAIDWHTDFASARQAAVAADRPILVFARVNEGGRKDAEHC